MKEYKIQDYNWVEKQEQGNEDEVYLKLKKIEKIELENIFISLKDNFEKYNFQKENLEFKLDQNLVQNIIETENSKAIIKKNIINEIQIIKSNENKYKIDHLTILIVGKRNIGKNSLIKYMLKLDDSDLKKVPKKDFRAYQSDSIPYLRLIKYKGIGYGELNDVERIKKKTLEYIKEQTKKTNYNDFIHCIWYIIKGQRAEDGEIKYLKELKKAYINVHIPLVIIYLNEYGDGKIKKMEESLKDLNVNFVNVIAKNIPRPDGKIEKVKGEKQLLNLTLNKCNEVLKGGMPKIMMENISNEINKKMKRNIQEKTKKITGLIEEKFMKEFNYVYKDNAFIDYILNLLGRNLTIFYDKQISNKSLNMILNSSVVKNVENFMKNVKKKTEELISNKVVSQAKNFLDLQVITERENNKSIRESYKRSLNGFINTNEFFLKQNFYYITQKYIIYILIINFCKDYFTEFQKKFNEIVENLMNSKGDDSEINIHIEDCFSSKLKIFGEKMNFQFNYDNFRKIDINSSFEIISNLKTDDEILLIVDEKKINSFNFELETYNAPLEENSYIHEDINLSNIFETMKFKSDWKYLTVDSIDSLNIFMKTFNYQDIYFNLKKSIYSGDNTLNSLKKYEENKLKSYFNQSIINFLNNIDKDFNFHFENYFENIKNLVKNIFENEKLSSVLEKKLDGEFAKIKKDKSITKIEYFTILVTGLCGAGKSSLINTVLKKYLAKEGMGRITTLSPSLYENQKVPYFRLIDTRGIEINKKYGVDQIFKCIKDIINDPSEIYKYQDEIQSNVLNKISLNSYNDNIQCIWYCVHKKSLEKEEIDFIKGLREGSDQNKLPIIVVYTYTTDLGEAELMEENVKKNFGDIPYLHILAKDEGDLKSYGLDKLIDITIKSCQKATRGQIFKNIKQITMDNIINIFKIKNSDIITRVHNEIVSFFINNYKNVLEKINFKKFAFRLLGLIFIGYLKLENELKSIEDLTEQSYNEFFSTNISGWMDDFIKYYEKITNQYIDPIKEEEAINFLDKQAKKEKKHGNLAIKDKCKKIEFIGIIENYLKNNFYYLGQKIYIYQFLMEVGELFSEKVRDEVNSYVNNILNNNTKIEHWFEDIYREKIENLKELIQNYYDKEGYCWENSIENRLSEEKLQDSCNEKAENLYESIGSDSVF